DLCLVLLLAVLLLLLLVAPCLNCLEAVKKPPPVAFKVMCLLPITIQIGRASCRERVEVCGVAVSLKKKKFISESMRWAVASLKTDSRRAAAVSLVAYRIIAWSSIVGV